MRRIEGARQQAQKMNLEVSVNIAKTITVSELKKPTAADILNLARMAQEKKLNK